MSTLDNDAVRIDFFRTLLLHHDTAKLEYLKAHEDLREEILKALDHSTKDYLTPDEMDSLNLTWFGEVSDILYGPDPHPPEIEDELKEITDHLENQAVLSGRLLLELVDSNDIPDHLRQLEEFFRGLEIASATRDRLLLDPSNRQAGNVLPNVLACVGLTPVCFFHAVGALSNVMLASARRKGDLTHRTSIEVVDSSSLTARDSERNAPAMRS